MPADPAGAEPIGVMVVDDHAFVRRGVRAYVDSVPSFRMIGEAGDGEEALALLRRWRTTGDPMPDVVLMDLHMPKLGGVEATEAISRAHPEVKVVVLTSFGEVERVHAALAAGAAGYLLKDAEPEEVGTAIRAAAVGEVHLDSAVARQLTRRMAAPRVGLSPLTGLRATNRGTYRATARTAYWRGTRDQPTVAAAELEA